MAQDALFLIQIREFLMAKFEACGNDYDKLF